MSKDPYSCISNEEWQLLDQYIEMQFQKVDEPDLSHLEQAGVLFPNRLPEGWDTLPDLWDDLMEEKGIVGLQDYELEEYLEKWLRLLGYAYWVRGIRDAQVNILQRTADYVKDYIFSHAEGGRELRAAVSGSHPLYKKVLDRLSEYSEKLTTLNGMIWKWEKIEFSISRTISNRSGKSYR